MQVLVFNTSYNIFTNEVNKRLEKGWDVVPGTLTIKVDNPLERYAVVLEKNE